MPNSTKLVIVESPTKGRTIGKFLGPEFTVAASFGHVRDLPKSKLGVDEETFEPAYVIPPKARKTISYLKKLIEKSRDVFIATDLDREGEAIGWHILQAVGLPATSQKPKPIHRIVFHEITKKAIEEALGNPRQIDQRLVDAQQARRILDRLVGYKLSPLLWQKVARGLSAGRVQSVAVRLIVDREREIVQFRPREFWSIEADLEKDKQRFVAILTHAYNRPLEKLAIKTRKEAETIIKDLAGANYQVVDIQDKTLPKTPYPPFTTSTLQQEAARQLGWSASKTMQVAQALYEKGFITYHRTDSVNLAWSAIGVARKLIKAKFGEDDLPPAPRQFKTRTRGAQEAHEAIRPTHADRTPDKVKTHEEEHKLYDLIWRRMIASQMSAAQIAEQTADIAAKDCLFRAIKRAILFDGFMKIWPLKIEAKELPPLEVGDSLVLVSLSPKQHFTEPPPRFNMASLIKALEEEGIGRPSTYAPIITTIIERNYVSVSRGIFFPTDMGKLVTDLLVEHFPEIVDISFTANMEEGLDAIAAGERAWKTILEDFYRPFARHLSVKMNEIQKANLTETLEEKCPECARNLVKRFGRFGPFVACSGFPQCKYTRPLFVELPFNCPQCREGKVVERKTRQGRLFWGCSRFPDCRWATWEKPSVREKDQRSARGGQE
jgi:DNA topoisomerase-1